MKVIIGTKNQKKINTVTSVFKDVLGISDIEIIAEDVKSNVPDAPFGRETYKGALNRALNCRKIGLADYYIGIESGLVKRYGNIFEEAWSVIVLRDGTKLVGYSSGLLLPEIVARRINNGEKHGEIMMDFDKILNLPRDNRDTWSRYTGGSISRQVSLQESLRNALIQVSETENNLYKYKKNL
jgi:inosine/xanthosine triphosphatase